MTDRRLAMGPDATFPPHLIRKEVKFFKFQKVQVDFLQYVRNTKSNKSKQRVVESQWGAPPLNVGDYHHNGNTDRPTDGWHVAKHIHLGNDNMITAPTSILI